MKKISILAAFAALALWACHTPLIEPVPEVPEQPEVPEVPAEPSFKVLTIGAGGPEQTKTSYKDDVEFSWSEGDQVSVLCNDGSSNVKVIFTLDDTPARSCRFSSPDVPGTYQTGPISGKRIALYPASDSHEFNGDTDVKFHLPPVRDFRTHKESAIPMFGYGDSEDRYSFANMTGAIKFTFTGIVLGEVKFVFTSAAEKINGTFPLIVPGGEDASAVTLDATTPPGAGEQTLTFYATVESGKVSFYVPSADNLSAGATVKLTSSDGLIELFEATTTKVIEVKKNQITVVNDLDVSPGDEHSPLLVHLDEDVKNPERGFTSPNTLGYTGSAYPEALYNISDINNSLVFIRFDITGYKTKDLDAAALNAIGKVFDDVRLKGKKAVFRFVYGGAYDDASPTRIKGHLNQLKSVFSAHQDVIYLVQAGFIGDCGEWNRSAWFSFSYPPSQSDEVYDFEDYAEVADALLDAVPVNRQVALRSAYYKRYYTYTKGVIPSSCWDWNPITGFGGTDYNSRLAFHNDAFGHDGGTFRDFGALGDKNDPKNIDRIMWYSQGAYLVCGGETYTDAPHSLFSQYPRVVYDLYDQHISYLGNDPTTSCLSELTSAQVDTLRKYMGYHLWLKEAKIYYSDTDPEALAAGKSITVSCTLQNRGAAPVIYQRPFMLVLLRGGSVVAELADLGDVRSVASNYPDYGVRTFDAKFNIPAGGIQPGDKLALWLPDASAYPDPSTSIARLAVYAIHLANDHDNDDTEWVTSNPSDLNDPTATGGYNVFYTFP